VEIEAASVAGVEVGTSGPRKGVANDRSSQAVARPAHDDAMKRIVGKRNHERLFLSTVDWTGCVLLGHVSGRNVLFEKASWKNGRQ
tara:strand:- start:652 stop:909 length:258 start_codon:yes stop_codon:yes gene_type:complete